MINLKPFIFVILIIIYSSFLYYKWNQSLIASRDLCRNESQKDNKRKSEVILPDDLIFRSESSVEGVAATLFLGSPRWFQNRYSMMVNNVLGVIPSSWKIQIFHNNKKMAVEGINYPGIQKLISQGRVIITLLPDEMRKLKKKEIMTSLWFWSNMLADRVLMFGGSGVFCSNSPLDLHNFNHFDYVGAPWREFRGMGGDGGMSLRDRNIMLDIIRRALAARSAGNPPSSRNDFEYVSVAKEDSFFVKEMIVNKSIRIAGPEDTALFAMNDVRAMGSPLAVQGVLGGVNESVRIQRIEYCPEMKLVFPVLQSPACFGAKPDPLSCFQSLCQFGGLKCEHSEGLSWSNRHGEKVSLALTVDPTN